MPNYDPKAAVQRSEQNKVSTQKGMKPFFRSAGAPKLPTSPVHDDLRRTAGTLERNMAALDKSLGSDPEYAKNRDVIKYRIQALMKAVSKTDRPIVVKDDAEAIGKVALRAEAERKAGRMLSEKEVASKGLALPKARIQKDVPRPDRYTERDPDETVFDVWDRLSQERGANSTHILERIAQLGEKIATPDPSKLIATPDQNSGFGQKAAWAAGKAAKGVMSNLNPFEMISGIIRLGDFATDQLLFTKPSEQLSPQQIADAMAGDSSIDKMGFLSETAGSIAGGIGLAKFLGRLGSKIKAPKGVPDAPVAIDAPAGSASPVITRSLGRPRGVDPGATTPRSAASSPAAEAGTQPSIVQGLGRPRAKPEPAPTTPTPEKSSAVPPPIKGSPAEPTVAINPERSIIDQVNEMLADGVYGKKTPASPDQPAIASTAPDASTSPNPAVEGKTKKGPKVEPAVEPTVEPMDAEVKARMGQKGDPGDLDAPAVTRQTEPAPTTDVSWAGKGDLNEPALTRSGKVLPEQPAPVEATTPSAKGKAGAKPKTPKPATTEPTLLDAPDATPAVVPAATPAAKAQTPVVTPSPDPVVAPDATTAPAPRQQAKPPKPTPAKKVPPTEPAMDPDIEAQVADIDRQLEQLRERRDSMDFDEYMNRRVDLGAERDALLERAKAATPEPAPAPKPKARKGPRPSSQRGAVDTRLLKLVAAGGVVGADIFSARDTFKDFYDKAGPEGVVGLATAAASIAGLVYAAKSGPKSLDAPDFPMLRATLDPKTIARRALNSKRIAERHFGETAQGILNARNEHKFRTAQSLQDIGKIGNDAFGSKDFLKSKEFLDGNAKVRDIMEQNVRRGDPWHKGLSPEWRKFVEETKKVMDELIDEAESDSVRLRVRVKNDGTQAAKLAPGAKLLYGGDLVEYLGHRPSKGGGQVLDIKMPDGTLGHIAPGDEFGRPIHRLGEGYVPRFLKGEFSEKLIDPSKMDAQYKKALIDMIERENPGLNGDDELAKMSQIAKGFEKNSDISSFLANLERERTMSLAKFKYRDASGKLIEVDPYENSYIDAVARYIDKGWKRTAIARNFGPNPETLGTTLNLISGRNAAYGRYVEDLLGRVLGIGPGRNTKTLDRALAKGEGAYQTLTKLTGGTTQISQVNDLMYSLTNAGFRKVFKAGMELRRQDIKELADVMAATSQQWVDDLHAGDAGNYSMTNKDKLKKGVKQVFTKGMRSEGLANLADSVMTGVGIKHLDASMKRLSAITGLRDVQSLIAQANEAVAANKPIPKRILKDLDAYGVREYIGRDPLSLEKDQVAMGRIAGGVRSRLSYTGAPEDFPLWMSTPGGNVITRFKKPAYVSTRFLLRDVLGSGDPKRIARFVTYGVALGGGSTYIKDLVRAEGMDAETRALWDKGDITGAISRFFSKPGEKTLIGKALSKSEARTFSDFIFAATHNIYDSGGAGIPGDMVPAFNRRSQDIAGNPAPQIWDPVKPITVAEVEEAMKRFGAVLSKSGTFNEKIDMPGSQPIKDAKSQFFTERALSAVTEQIKSSISPVRRISDMLNLKTDIARIDALERKKKRDGDLSPQDAKELGIINNRVNGWYEKLKAAVEAERGAKPKQIVDIVNKEMGITSSGGERKRR